MTDRTVLGFDGVWKSYPQTGREALHALRDVSLSVDEAQSVAIVGRSGSGKSTLLHLAAGIDETIDAAFRPVAALLSKIVFMTIPPQDHRTRHAPGHAL